MNSFVPGIAYLEMAESVLRCWRKTRASFAEGWGTGAFIALETNVTFKNSFLWGKLGPQLMRRGPA
jgi:hypothetical protein